MSDNKRDLTRIEDLGEYLHELSEGDADFEPPPELPEETTSDFGADSPSFETSETFESAEEPSFGATEEEPAFVSTEEDPSFTSEESSFGEDNTFTTEEPAFGSSEEEASPFTTEDNSISSLTDETFAGFKDEKEEDPKELSGFEPEIESEPEAQAEPEPEPIFMASPVEEQAYKAPENFEDLKKFAESSTFSGMSAEGNPSFSVLLKNVRYIEDVNDILSMLKELGLLSDSENQVRERLMRGHLLVPRISEFAAIFLAHKLRRFDIDIQVGLSDEIHPPKHQETPETGIVSRHHLHQNQIHHFHFDDPKLELSQIIVAASSNLEGHQVIRYLGVASEHKMLEGHIVEDEGSQEIPRHYSELAQKLKAHALKAHANAVIGLNYQLTPLPSEYGISSSKYRLSCTGNLVWVNKL